MNYNYTPSHLPKFVPSTVMTDDLHTRKIKIPYSMWKTTSHTKQTKDSVKAYSSDQWYHYYGKIKTVSKAAEASVL